MTQAERELIYSLRSFERFKRTFAVDVVQQYYAVLQAEDLVKINEVVTGEIHLLQGVVRTITCVSLDQ